MAVVKHLYNNSLGKCSRCGNFFDFSLLEIPIERLPESTRCATCSEKIKLESQGLELQRDGFYKRVSWIGPSGEWTKTKPTCAFILSLKKGQKEQWMILVSPDYKKLPKSGKLKSLPKRKPIRLVTLDGKSVDSDKTP